MLCHEYPFAQATLSLPNLKQAPTNKSVDNVSRHGLVFLSFWIVRVLCWAVAFGQAIDCLNTIPNECLQVRSYTKRKASPCESWSGFSGYPLLHAGFVHFGPWWFLTSSESGLYAQLDVQDMDSPTSVPSRARCEASLQLPAEDLADFAILDLRGEGALARELVCEQLQWSGKHLPLGFGNDSLPSKHGAW